MNGSTASKPQWAKVLDQSRCIGCHACTTACKSENEVPLSVTRTYVKSVDVGVFPEARRAFQVTRCNQCADAPCVAACPTSAMYVRPDGIVDFNKSICIGCKACIAACPYDAIFINPNDHSAEKCNFCAHRIDSGLEPACVVVCPTQAIIVGDLNDPNSKVAQVVNRQPVSVRRPEKATRPKLFYKAAHEATLDPLAAKRPPGGLYAWANQPTGKREIGAGVSDHSNSSAAAILSYDVSHKAPWDWRVSAYTWTKGIASGVYLVGALLALTGALSWTNTLWTIAVPILSLIFLGATGVLLIADLKHPERFYLIFLRPQWRSWLVRGGFIIGAYSFALLAHLAAALAGRDDLTRYIVLAGLPLAVMTAIYTAYLFAQAKARDLWQNPLLPAHLIVQSLLLGSATLIPFALAYERASLPALFLVLGVTAALHVLLVLTEISVGHPTKHAQLAAHIMAFGKYAPYFWTGLAFSAFAIGAPWLGALAVPGALIGVLAHEHAYVQAGQAVPLA